MGASASDPLSGPLLGQISRQVDNLPRHMHLIPFYHDAAFKTKRNSARTEETTGCALFRPVAHPVARFLNRLRTYLRASGAVRGCCERHRAEGD